MKHLKKPKNLKIEKLIARFNTDHIRGFHKDKVYYVTNSLYQQMQYLNEDSIYPGKSRIYFVPLMSQLLKDNIGSSYSKILEWMNKVGIIEMDKSWEAGKISKGYKFTDKYLGAHPKWVSVTYPPFLKVREYNTHISPAFYLEARVVKRLIPWFNDNKLKIDYAGATNALKGFMQQELKKNNSDINNNIQIVRYNARLSAVENIHSKRNQLKQDEFGYRVHTSLTQLKKELRQFITYDDNRLVQLDIKNSQLFFIVYLLNAENWKLCDIKTKKQSKIWVDIYKQTTNKHKQYYNTIMYLKSMEKLYSKGLQDSDFVKKVCEGELYESIRDNIINTGMPDKVDRNYVKRTLLMQLFCNPKDHSYLFAGDNANVWNSFKKLYPYVVRIIEDIKRHNHKHMSMLLQRIESTAILSYVCKRTQKTHPNVPIFTIHDCIVTTEQNLLIVQREILLGITEFIGLTPKLDIKKWDNNALNQEYNSIAA